MGQGQSESEEVEALKELGQRVRDTESELNKVDPKSGIGDGEDEKITCGERE